MGKKVLSLAILALAAYGAIEAVKYGKSKYIAMKASKTAPSTTT